MFQCSCCSQLQHILAHNLLCHFPLCFSGVAITAGLTAAGTGKRLSSATVWRHHRVISTESFQVRGAYSQIAYGKLCARLFNYLILWVRLWLRVGVLGNVDPNRYPYPNPNNNPNANPTLTLIVSLTPNLPWL